jgi:glycosyltransferase involved in cell wall biosynthesis
MTLTILTPTYNRAHLLPRLYKSLLAQTCKDFVWLVVDDGSTDGTEELVGNWQTEGSLQIKYIKKENGGKSSALSVGILSTADTDLIFFCDSDDWLMPKTMETCLAYHKKYKGRSDICGFSFHKQTEDGKYSGGPFPQKEFLEHYHKFQVNRWHGETAQAFYAHCLKEFMPLDFSGKRKLATEDIRWIPMGFKYRTVYIDEPLQYMEYQADGYSKNMRLHHNYQAQYQRAYLLQHPEIKFSLRLRGALMANVYARFLGIKPKRNLLVQLMHLPGWAVYRIWKWKYGMEEEKVL